MNLDPEIANNELFFTKILDNTCVTDTTEIYYDGEMREANIVELGTCCSTAIVTFIRVNADEVVVVDVKFSSEVRMV